MYSENISGSCKRDKLLTLHMRFHLKLFRINLFYSLSLSPKGWSYSSRDHKTIYIRY